MEPIQLYATVPQIQSAIKVGGDGSCRLQFDVSASEMPELLKLIAYGREKLLRLTIEATDGEGGW